MNCILKRAGCLCLALILIVMLCASGTAAVSAEDQTGNHRIAIVLDNSDSMIIKPGSPGEQEYLSRWAEATHALKTFLYMVEDTDTVGLFTVAASSQSNSTAEDHKRAATISYDINKDNIAEQLEKVGISFQTKTYGIDAAYEWVAQGGADKEKWVVILSDGEFYPEDTISYPLSYMESVGNKAAQENNNNIHTIFVGLEIDDSDLEELRNSGALSVNSTESGKGIEETILSISEEIYGMKEQNLNLNQLPSSTEFIYDRPNQTLTWSTQPSLSSYLRQVIVIVQVAQISEEESEDGHLQVIHSDNTFSWCSEDKLGEILTEHDEKSKLQSEHFIFGGIDIFQSKIKDTFLNQDCYIYSYAGNELEDGLSIQLPEGVDSCRIYYELREDIVPGFTIKRNGEEIQTESNGTYCVPEGTIDIDYVLYAGTTVIPKNLQVIAPELGDILVKGADGEETGNRHSFSYLDTGNNSYSVSTIFDGKETTQALQVEIDVQNYSFGIPQSQTLNIDKPAENQLRIETQLPIDWLNSHLQSCLQVTSEAEGGQLLFDVDALEVRGEEQKNVILIPVQTDGSKLDLTQVFPVKAVLEAGGANRREVEGEIRLTQEIPEIVSQVSGTAPALDKLSVESVPTAKIIAIIEGQEKSDGNIEIIDPEVVGIGVLEGVALEYDEDSGKVYVNASLLQRLRLLRSGKSQGEAILRGTVYRNGVEVDPDLECKVVVSWSGSWGILILKCVLFFLLIILIMAVLWATANGRLMSQEFFSRLLRDTVRKERYFLSWSDHNQPCEVTRNHGLMVSPTKVKLLFPDEYNFRARSGGAWIELTGTKKGYKMTAKSHNQLSASGVRSENRNLDYENDTLEFRCGDDTCSLVYCRSRGWALPLMLTALACGLVLLLVYHML